MTKKKVNFEVVKLDTKESPDRTLRKLHGKYVTYCNHYNGSMPVSVEFTKKKDAVETRDLLIRMAQQLSIYDYGS